ncbi:MAG: hypothetical protein ACRCW1_01765 [Anaerotignaceae bacterium]
MEIFKENGHLTEYAFELLKNNEASQMDRLEISEHLSFCDECLMEYTDFLMCNELIEPSVSVKMSVMKGVHRKIRQIFVNRYSRTIVAASLASVFWTSGVFNTAYTVMYNTTVEKTYTVVENINNKNMEFFEGLDQLKKSVKLYLRGDIEHGKK